MRIPTFTLPEPAPEGDYITLPPDQAKHARLVLRLKNGQSIKLLDSLGQTNSATVEISNKEVKARLNGPWNPPAALVEGGRIHLALAIIKPGPFEMALQKSVELGAASFKPLISGRVNPFAKFNPQRLSKIALEAQKQCGRAEPLLIHDPEQLNDYLTSLKSYQGPKIFFSPLADSKAPWPLPTTEEIYLTIGPEGGFTPEEEALAQSCGFTPLNLGPLILRAETAALAALAIFGYLGRV